MASAIFDSSYLHTVVDIAELLLQMHPEEFKVLIAV
jgi:hypothetical protein